MFKCLDKTQPEDRNKKIAQCAAKKETLLTDGGSNQKVISAIHKLLFIVLLHKETVARIKAPLLFLKKGATQKRN